MEKPLPACSAEALTRRLTEQVIPGHIDLFLRLHGLENEDPVMVKVLQQFFTVKRDPTASLHQVPAVETQRPVYTKQPSLRKEKYLTLI